MLLNKDVPGWNHMVPIVGLSSRLLEFPKYSEKLCITGHLEVS